MAAANGDPIKAPLLSADHLEAAAETAGNQLALKPVKPLGLAWRNVTLHIPVKKAKRRGRGKEEQAKQPLTKEILHGVGGEAPAGAVTAIMGPTGSGKSSLLNALAGRVAFTKGAKLEGEVYVNGRAIDYALMPKICAYVVQDDVLYEFLTVRETLTLAGHFHLPPSMGEGEKAAYVTEVINALGLAKAANTIIGDQRVRGVSGGERKRVSVGVELISNPALLFLDEPTSGLDSFQALSVMGAMRALARSGRTVVAAIHQPRSSIYDLLDSLVLVSEGRVLYAGPATDAADYFAGRGLVCPPNFCPSDFFLDMISMDYRSPELEQATRARIAALTVAWAAGMHAQGGMEEGKAEEGDGELVVGEGEDGYRASWGSQFLKLFARSFKQARRNRFVLVVKTVSSVFFALILGAIYSKRTGNPPTQAAIQNFIGALFFVATNQAFANLQSVIQIFPLEKHIVQKERAAKSYHLSAYFLSKLLAELPLTLVGPLLFSCTAYFIVGLQAEAGRFLVFVAICMLEAVCAVSLGLFVSAIAPDVPSATALAPPITIVFMLVGGVFINVKSLPQGAQWLPYLSFIKWAFNAFAVNQFTGMTFQCEDAADKGCVTTGEQVLRLYAMDQYGIADCALAITGITIAFTALGYVVLKVNSRKYLQMKPSAAAAAVVGNGAGHNVV